MSRCNSAISLLAALGLLAGCASTATRPSLYAQLGGQAGVEAISEDLLMRSAEDPRIAFQFAEADIVNLHAQLSTHLCAISDGPCTYRGRDMRAAHLGLGITEAHFNALVENLIDAMDARQLPVTTQNALLARLAPMRSDVIHR
jgi:hemoglobin